MATRAKPRKPPAGSDEDLSVGQLASIPLKRRLEILFASNIIPCRRQLAIKYELSERLIHNVLSHRKYLLENWKYNADGKSLLSKLELENAMAMTELLIEWKRRVQLSGLQITDTALTRKAVYLQRVLNGSNSNTISDEWWDQFEINWVYKRFQDYESDSLEIEDILNDLQWMFSENTFRRLMSSFRKAKSGSRMSGTIVKRMNISTIKTEDDFDDFEEYFDISDITAEPHYYNDDDFDCEDYEFVLDEEVVIDALRRELEDSEQAKYQQYLLGGISSDSVSQDEEKLLDAFVGEGGYVDDDADHADAEDNDNEGNDVEGDDDIVHKMNSTLEETSAIIANASAQSIIKHENSPNPLPIDSSSATSVTVPTLPALPTQLIQATQPIQPTQPKQPKRKPRNLHAILSLRKDYVRMPAQVEVAQLARKQCLEQLLNESDESDEDFDSKQQQKKQNRKKYVSLKSKSSSSSAQHRAYNSRAKNVMLNSNATRSSPEDFTNELIGMQNSHADTQLDFGTYAISSKHSFSYDSFNDIKQEMPSPIISDNEEFIIEDNQIIGQIKVTDITTDPQTTSHEQNNNVADKLTDSQVNVDAKVLNGNTRHSSRISAKETLKLPSDLDNVTILDGAFSYDVVLNSNAKPEIDIEEEISGTAIQTKDNQDSQDDCNQQIPTKRRIAKTRKFSKSSNKKPMRLAKGKQANSTPNANKRAKRRTDGSDLTLRKDKVRLSLVPSASEKDVENLLHQIATQIDTDVQMVFEPYMGEE